MRSFEISSRKDLVGRYTFNRTLNHWPSTVGSQCFAALCVHFYGDARLKPRGFEPIIEAAFFKAKSVSYVFLAVAQSSDAVPDERLKRVRQLADSPSRTFIPMLGTALLAKATNRFVDALSLRAGESHKSYSARSLAKDVFVPCAKQHRIDIGT